jgi:hypothetical protein
MGSVILIYQLNYDVDSSRADDLESLFYMLMHLLTGELPWKLSGKRSLKFSDVAEMKNMNTPDSLWP